MKIAVVPTGVANLASVLGALRRLGAPAAAAVEADTVAGADAVVLPGVGDFGAGMRALRARGLAVALRERIARGRPTLAICLGMQLCFQRSDEAPGVAGLAALPGEVTAFPPGARAPQMGWNQVAVDPDAALLRPGHAYFANSYRATACPPGWRGAWAEHGGPFLAACERGPMLLCQFHPELSSGFGRALLQRWLQAAAAAIEAPC